VLALFPLFDLLAVFRRAGGVRGNLLGKYIRLAEKPHTRTEVAPG
jgi:hypothetical protein